MHVDPENYLHPFGSRFEVNFLTIQRQIPYAGARYLASTRGEQMVSLLLCQ